jgi:hypothetical protein
MNSDSFTCHTMQICNQHLPEIRTVLTGQFQLVGVHVNMLCMGKRSVRTRRGRFEGGARRAARAHTLGQPLLHASSEAATPNMKVRRAVAVRARSISREDTILFFSRMTQNPMLLTEVSFLLANSTPQ